jgi:hypothetical protein
MAIKLNMEGLQFARWTVIERGENDSEGRVRWICKCVCGNTGLVLGKLLRNSHSRSCGCLLKDWLSATYTTHGHSKGAKGHTKRSSEYNIWADIKQRCRNKDDKGYPNYGGRGIKMCDEWYNSFELFLKDVGVRPSPEHSLDRINNDGDYEPSNCRWATRDVQSRNKRTNIWVEHNGQRMIITDWAIYFGISIRKFNNGIKKGKTHEEVVAHLYNTIITPTLV